MCFVSENSHDLGQCNVLFSLPDMKQCSNDIANDKSLHSVLLFENFINKTIFKFQFESKFLC